MVVFSARANFDGSLVLTIASASGGDTFDFEVCFATFDVWTCSFADRKTSEW